MSADVAARKYRATLVLNSGIYIDGVFMGICAKIVGVSPQDHVFLSGQGKAPYHPCIFDRMITSHRHGHVLNVASGKGHTIYNSRGLMHS